MPGVWGERQSTKAAYDATRRLLPGRTLIFLDEIQECPNARTALKSFALERDSGIVPVEVKSSNGATISLNELLEKPQVPYGYKLVDGNLGVMGKKITLPHYMAMFIFRLSCGGGKGSV